MTQKPVLQYRNTMQTIRGIPSYDGAGVKMTRIIGSPVLDMLDPFLLLDEFRSDQPGDYIGGFPDHPHRGFDTVTYMLAGKMRHRDNQGHEGVITPGGIQWMRAGRGIIHSEMPEQDQGLMWGFQLWINLPADQKMTHPGYQEFDQENIPTDESQEGVRIHVIAGTTANGTSGPVKNIPTDPLYLDIEFAKLSETRQPLKEQHNTFVYIYEGTAEIHGTEEQPVALVRGMLAILGKGDGVCIRAVAPGTRALLVSAMPLNEPVARGGPFVMNTRVEIIQAFQDFNTGKF